MLWKPLRPYVATLGALCGLTALLTAPPGAQAGGFAIVAELPTTASHPKDAALILSMASCHGKATLTATAEGLVGCKRTSLPLQLDPLPDGSYSLKRQWPDKGVWVLSVQARSVQPFTSAQGKQFHITDSCLIPLGPQGMPEALAPSATSQSTSARRIVRKSRLADKNRSTAIDTTLSDLARTAAGVAPNDPFGA